MIRIPHSHRIWGGIGLLVGDALFFCITNPAKVASIWLIVGYALLSASIVYLFDSVSRIVNWYDKRGGRLSKRFGRYAAAVFILVLGLQSIGQLGVKDIASLLPFVALTFMYLSYLRPARATD